MMSDTTTKGTRASGRFVLRLDPGLHLQLREEARDKGLSLNEFCVRKLAQPGFPQEGPASAAVGRAKSLVGEALVGVVLFGSWVRNEARSDSDVDLLLVLEEGTPVRRGLYRSWDGDPVTWKGHDLEPHFVHLPEVGSRLSGLWAEVAIDGRVLFEKELRVSRRLMGFRREVASGRISRREIHGQSYWAEAE